MHDERKRAGRVCLCAVSVGWKWREKSVRSKGGCPAEKVWRQNGNHGN